MASSSKKLLLKSSDDATFEVDVSVAEQCLTIKHMTEDLGDSHDPIPLPNVNGKILSKVIEYCNKHVDDANTEHGATSTNDENLAKWDKEFLQALDQNTVFELVLAANYMNVKSLLDVTCQHIADLIKDMSPEEVRKIFNIENDFTPEEEEAIRREHPWAFE